MDHMTSGGASPTGNRFDEVEAILARYPHIEEHELRELQSWFRREASAFEVASLASKESLQSQYVQFRADHIDRFTGRDALAVLVVAGLIGAIVVAIYFAG